MHGFEPVTPAAFCDAVTSKASPLMVREWGRCVFADPAAWYPDCSLVHHGSISVESFRAPEFNTLILGDLSVAGLLDLAPGYEQGAGTFVVIGNVTCRDFIGERNDSVFIDGDLTVSDLLLNALPDSSLTVAGRLRTRFFYGRDIWATVGRGADLDYGDGYCLPVGYDDAARQAIRPRHGTEASRKVLAVDQPRDNVSAELSTLLRDGRSAFHA